MSPKSAYLVGYNVFAFCGWFYTLYLTITTLIQGGGVEDVWAAIEWPLTIAQSAALLEVIHAAVGLVRSPVMVTAMQVASRIFVVWGILRLVPEETTTQSLSLGFQLAGLPMEIGLVSLMMAWCPTEIIRYSFYAFKELLCSTPFPIVWLRYTTFIFLYPLGVASELSLLWLALPRISASNMLSLEMPNPWNVAFSYTAFCYIAAASYVPGFPQMYFYMVAQRKKVLGKPKRD